MSKETVEVAEEEAAEVRALMRAELMLETERYQPFGRGQYRWGARVKVIDGVNPRRERVLVSANDRDKAVAIRATTAALRVLLEIEKGES